MRTRGVYILRHRPTKWCYVGSSTRLDRRRTNWWRMLRRDLQDLPSQFRALSPFVREDWDFNIVHVVTSVSLNELREAEQRVLSMVKVKSPGRVLNTLLAIREYEHGLTYQGRSQSLRGWSRERSINRQTINYRLRAGWSTEQVLGFAAPPTTERKRRNKTMVLQSSLVLVKDGNKVLSQSEAALQLGCGAKTLANRLKRYRVPGQQAAVQLKHLRQLSERFRQ